MNLADLLPDPEVLLALDPDELGLRILQVLRNMPVPPAHQLDTFTNTVIGHPQTSAGGAYPLSYRQEVKRAIQEAWAWLEGQGLLLPDPQYVDRGAGPRVLSRRGSQLAEQSDPRRALSAQRLPKTLLHPNIREDVWALYHRGKYDTAVFEAMKAVEVCVRDPPVRDAGIPNFDKPDPDRPGVVRSASILSALRQGTPLPPLLLFQRVGERRYELREGFHRLHLFAALGYTHVPAMVTDWKPGEY